MGLRTYYWQPSLRAEQRRPARGALHVGNFGDLFTAALIQQVYSVSSRIVQADGRRLLLTGSIAHTLHAGDVVCGVGTKGKALPHPRETEGVRILGLRGPLTYDAFRRRGYDVSTVRFLRDPGLFVRFMVGDSDRTSAKGASFLPHYRERLRYTRHTLPRGIRLLTCDAEPLKVAEDILSSELVYTSSLHGIIFSHALRRPCVFVRPQTAEPLLKYADYFASIDRPLPKVLTSIADARFHRSPDSPIHLPLE
ncbi:MAG: polysaccharide pyruvyl transferase family protein, partial [Myxococcota bacterium]